MSSKQEAAAAAAAGCDVTGDDAARSDVRAGVRQYYGRDLQTGADVVSGVNCLKAGPPLTAPVSAAFRLVHPDVTLRYFGCGPVIPEALEGCRVLDLGSGCGRDVFAVSKLIGPLGHVVGIDMTEEQLAFAKSYQDYHMDKFGYSKHNVDFRFGYIEKLADAGIAESSFDLVISNCVVCLCPDKGAVLREAHRALKDGGEMYFSDMYTDSAVSDAVKTDHVMWGEGLGGALQWQELYRLCRDVGFSQPRLFTASLVNTLKFDHLLDGAKFVSVTYRLFKLPRDVLRAPRCATYLGGLDGCEEKLVLDHATAFTKNQGVTVDAELAALLTASRFKDFFRLTDVTGGDPDDLVTTASPRVDPVQFATQQRCPASS